MKGKLIWRLFLCLILCVGGGYLSGIVTRQGIADWYNHLNLPAGTPPNYVFPIVWTILYIFMAIALALLWSSPTKDKKNAIFFFMLQLTLNFSWSWIFFGLRSPGIALIDLFLLWAAIIGTVITFKKHTSLGAVLLIPYFAWVTYAMYLNTAIWLNN